MHRHISKLGMTVGAAACAVALGACFHPAPQEAVTPAGNYGGTVVAYPAYGYGYAPYLDAYGYSPYGYSPYGYSPYAYGYGYGFGPPLAVIRRPIYVRTPVGNGITPRPGGNQYGLRPWNGGQQVGHLRPPGGAPVTPTAPGSTGRVAQPRHPKAAAARPSPVVSQKPSVPHQPTAAPRRATPRSIDHRR